VFIYLDNGGIITHCTTENIGLRSSTHVDDKRAQLLKNAKSSIHSMLQQTSKKRTRLPIGNIYDNVLTNDVVLVLKAQQKRLVGGNFFPSQCLLCYRHRA
jgi:hypothetical protein